MREIKFRIWDKDNAYWLPGELNSSEWLTLNEYIKQEQEDNCILMQYTGLKDKNGKEIYEGDIVKAVGQSENYIQIIEFHNSAESCGRGWIGRNIKRLANPVKKTPEKDISDRFSYFCWPTTWEVIGNIYENPELLKGKEGSEEIKQT